MNFFSVSTKALLLFLGAFFLTACGKTEKDVRKEEVSLEELDVFVERLKSQMVFVEGGEFLMGDFGPEYGAQRLRYDRNSHSRPLHKVILSSYSINKFKIRNEDYQFYLKYMDLKLREDIRLKDYLLFSSLPNNPAPMDWFEAEKYCSWLGEVTGLPFGLPTEAQWEYAARSRGQFLAVATDDNTYRRTQVPTPEYDGPRGLNISTYWDRKDYSREMGWDTGAFTLLPVDRFPPNPLGLYSMSDNGEEWVKDWYDPEYYKNSPVKDPQGPEVPVHKNYFGQHTKVMRGEGFPDSVSNLGVNVYRQSRSPDGDFSGNGHKHIYSTTARCVVNHEEPVN